MIPMYFTTFDYVISTCSLGENQGSALTPSANNPSGKDSVLNPHSNGLLTAYEKKESLANDKSTDTATTSLGGDTALSQTKESAAKQADREDGQLLILPSNKEEVGALSDPTVNLSAAKIDNSSETAKENGEKFSLKDEKMLAGVHNITEEKLFSGRKAIRIDEKDKVLSLINSLRTNPEEAERIGLNLDLLQR